MALIKVEHLTFGFNEENLFNDVNLNIDTNWKLGLIGRNGKGKTTFLKLLLGKYEYRGKIISDNNFEYFPYSVDKNELVVNIAYQICPNIYEWQLIKEFNLLKLRDDILYCCFSHLSNGEQTKILLALLFLKENNFLLIDEPTNYLDLEGRKIVSQYLSTKSGFILISHDRDFLDNTIDHVLSINKNNIELVKGNFSSWYYNKELQDNYEIDKNNKLKKEIKRLQDTAKQKANWSDKIEKTKYGNSHADKGYIGHKSAKMMQLAKNLENRQIKLINDKKSLLQNIEEISDLKMFPLNYHNQVLLRIENLNLNYNKEIFTNLNFTVESKERILIKGLNGSGKSSLLKIIVGHLDNYKGKLIKNENLKISYIPQNTECLEGTLTEFILENNINETLFKTILIKLGFQRLDFLKSIDNYSMGMKKKVLLAKSLSEQAHLYIWDEPLNYIDVISRIQIEKVILEYQPTMIFVEHDQKFCDNVATKIIEI